MTGSPFSVVATGRSSGTSSQPPAHPGEVTTSGPQMIPKAAPNGPASEIRPLWGASPAPAGSATRCQPAGMRRLTACPLRR